MNLGRDLNPNLRKMIVAFPLELLVMILNELEYRDLLACSMVCKHLHGVVKHVVELVYKIELAVDGFADEPSDLNTSERLRILLDLRSRWRALRWIKQETVHLYPGRLKEVHMHYAQGVFAQATSRVPDDAHFDRSVVGTLLPTRSTESEARGSLVDDYDAFWVAFCMDPTADVVILAEATVLHPDLDGPSNEPVQTQVILHPRSLSSHGTLSHPDCRVATLELTVETDEVNLYEPKIAGDVVGICVEDKEYLIAIWNWKSGDMLVKMTHEDYSFSICDFAFISPRSFVVVASGWDGRSSKQQSLILFTFGDDTSDGLSFTLSVGTVKHVASLCLPELAHGQPVRRFLSTAVCASYKALGIPFIVDHPTRLLLLDIEVGGQYYGDRRTCLRMIVHTNVLMRAIKSKPISVGSSDESQCVSWEAWGPESSRIFVTKAHDCVSFPQRPIHGTRVVVPVIEGCKQRTQVMDFNIRAHPHKSSGDFTSVVTERSVLKMPSVFKKPVITSLPYSATCIPDGHLYDGFMLDEQRLLCMKVVPRSLGSGLLVVEEIEVFSF